jgi:hypothetical protein
MNASRTPPERAPNCFFSQFSRGFQYSVVEGSVPSCEDLPRSIVGLVERATHLARRKTAVITQNCKTTFPARRRFCF